MPLGRGMKPVFLFFSRFSTSFIVNWLPDFKPFSSFQSSGSATGAPGRARTRIIGNGRGRIVVAEVIDEDFARPLCLAHGGDISLRRRRHHLLGQRGGEGFHNGPFILAGERHGDMQSFAAGAFQDGFQPFMLEALPQILRRELERFERNVRRRVEIEDHPVRIIDRIDRSTPGMQLDRAHLDHFQQAFLILDIEIFVILALVLEVEGLDVRAEAPAGIALKKTLAVDARRGSAAG